MAPVRKEEITSSSEKEDNPEILGRWKRLAEIRQQELCELVGYYNWVSFKKNEEEEHLEKKVEYILFGPTQNTIDESTKELINNICTKIINVGNNTESSEDKICMAFIYIFWPLNDSNLQCLPIFKVPKDKTSLDEYFIDINARVYADWKDFLNNNKFPPCEYCYPEGGKYILDAQNKVVLEFALSPAAKISNKLVECLDYANASLSLGTMFVTAASIFAPLSSPLLATTAWVTRGISAYSVIRSGTTLHDRQTHKQNIGLRDTDSRSCWLAIGSSTLGAVSSFASKVTEKLARSGQVVGKVGCTTINVLSFSNVALNGVGLLNHIYGLMEKRKNQKLSSLDILNLSASLLLFAHSAVNVKTAKSIIENAQSDVLQEFENSLRSNKHKKMFRRVAENTRGEDNIEGNARIIRGLKHIKNKDDFLSALVRMKKQFGPTGNKVSFAEGGSINVDGHLSVEPDKLVSISKEDRIQLLKATKNYASNHISQAEFIRVTQSILGEIPSPPTTSNNSPSLKHLLGLGQARISLSPRLEVTFSYPLLNAYERKELIVLLKKFAEADHERILQMVSTLFRALGWTLGMQYVETTYFICGLLRNLANESLNERSVLPSESGMSASEYCKAAVQEFLQDPKKLVDVFQKVRRIWQVTTERGVIPTQLRKVTLFELAQITSILLRVDEPLWLRCLQCSEEMLQAFGLHHQKMIVCLVKELCLYIFKTLQYMEQKHTPPMSWTANADKLWIEANQQRTNDYCNTILDVVSTDDQIKQSLMEEIWENYSLTSERGETETFSQLHTKQQPLEILKTFWNEEQLQLLSEEEILDICKDTLESADWPSINNIEYDGSNIFVNIDDKLIVIQCNFDEGKISAFVDDRTS